MVCERPAMPQEKKKTERERRKYLEPKKYEVFKKKEAAHVGEYHLKKVIHIESGRKKNELSEEEEEWMYNFLEESDKRIQLPEEGILSALE